ncbi:unnamed protein product [Cochlearia groenlandica]
MSAAKVVFEDTSESYASSVHTTRIKSVRGGCSKSSREESLGLKSPVSAIREIKLSRQIRSVRSSILTKPCELLLKDVCIQLTQTKKSTLFAWDQMLLEFG